VARLSKTRKSKPTIGIVGEGITEQLYFNEFKQVEVEKLSVNVKPERPYNSDFERILGKAQDLVESGNDYVFCLVDMDKIRNNSTQMRKYEKSRKSAKNITFIESNPCFELWFLLHYISTSRHFLRCKDIEKELKMPDRIPDYEKSKKYFEHKKLYNLLKDKLNIAKNNASRLDNSREKNNNSEFPYTQIYRIFEELNI